MEKVDLTAIDPEQQRIVVLWVQEVLDREYNAAGPDYSNIGKGDRSEIDDFWKTAAETVPQLKENVLKIKREYISGVEAGLSYDEQVIIALNRRFEKFEDPYAQELMIYISLARIQAGGSQNVNSIVENLNKINPDWSKIGSREVIESLVLGNL